MNKLTFSVIIPVYNRPDEMEELLQSLVLQSYRDFEVIVVEDGSLTDCKSVVSSFQQQLEIHYYFKPNTGPGDSRNFGMSKAKGDYLVFFDSDCLVPDDYFQKVHAFLSRTALDAYGGPDRAHKDFTSVQKAINYAMTSFLTTGGIRGRKKQLDRFQPRSFNMGLSRVVYQKVGGFASIHPGEDPDLSYRIQHAGFKTGLIPEAYVYHKRRIDLKKFSRQVYKFGLARTILMKWHPDSRKWVYWLPSLGLVGMIALLLLGIFNPLWWLPLVIGGILLLLDAWANTGSLAIAWQAVWATAVQITGYGWGFLKGIWFLKVLGRDEKTQFPGMFFQNVPNSGA